MDEQQGTIEKIGIELARFVDPLGRALEDPVAFSVFMLKLGWQLEGIPAPLRDMLPQLQTIIEIVDELADGEGAGEDRVPELIQNVVQLIQDIVALKDAPASAFPPELVAQNFLADFPVQLLGYLIASYLKSYRPVGFGLLSLFGIIEEFTLAGGEPPERIFYYLVWSAFADLFTDPNKVFERVYGWGTTDFNALLVYRNAGFLLNSLGLPAYYKVLDADVTAPLEETVIAPEDILRESLRVPLYRLAAEGGDISGEIGFGIYGLPAVDSRMPGLSILPYILGEVETEIQLSDDFQLIVEGSADAKIGLGIVLRPDEDIKFIADLFPDSGSSSSTAVTASFAIGIAYANEASTPKIIIGSPDASRLEVKSISLKSQVDIETDRDPELKLEMALQGGKVVINTGDGDGFLQSILGDGLNANFDLTLGWSNLAGLYFRGSGGLEIVLPTHIELGPLEIQNLVLGVLVKDDGKIPVTVGAGIKANLGALVATVENMGLKAEFSFPSEGGNLGPLNLDLGFKPPNGVGLSVDAGVVKGGGYLYFDFDREEYAGALELVFSEWIALKAIGLVTTRMPDGSKGFSLLILITVEFGSGIQLGFGFTLLGVGGLLGLNRTVNIDPLAEGVRTGAIESVMFPQNVIENAPRIISDLRQFFPVAEGVFLIGPMAKIGYGTPTLVSISIGIILEFPDVTITILGVLKVALPTEEADVLRLQVNFVGRIEPENKLLWFYAELYESRVLFMTLEGGMGLLVNWGDQANFVVSVGGFHPRYTPPPLPFDEPPRLAITILNTSVARIRVEAYFAVTSNTVQFGARAELFFGFSAINVEGHLSFDALFQFNPFYFILEISAGLSVKVFGFGLWSISLSASLEGPTPWHIKGKASFKVTFLGPKIKVNIEKRWGEEQTTELPPIAVLPLLQQELDAKTNWEAVVPAGNQLLVSLRQLGESDTEKLVLHPVGTLRVRQRKMPLNLQMAKFGTQRPSDYNQFGLSASVSGANLSLADVQDQFASAEFLDLENAKKLSSPGFEWQDSGLELTPPGSGLKTSMAVRRENRYETIVIDNNFRRFPRNVYKFVDTIFTQLGGLFGYFLQGSAVTKSVLSQAYQQQVQPFAEVVTVNPGGFTVASNQTNSPVSDAGMNFTSQSRAEQFMASELMKDPSLAGTLHVIPNVELNLAA